MSRKIDMKKILDNNPQVDVNQLEESRKLSEELKSMGLKKRKYKLATPNSRKRVHVCSDLTDESRTTQLSRF